jgi:hypothetical protein
MNDVGPQTFVITHYSTGEAKKKLDCADLCLVKCDAMQSVTLHRILLLTSHIFSNNGKEETSETPINSY